MLIAKYDPKVKIQYPLKQGLKPSEIVAEAVGDGPVKIQYPLKQGLKPDSWIDVDCTDYVKIQYPLKQGLKLL